MALKKHVTHERKRHLRHEEKRLADFVSLPTMPVESHWMKIRDFLGENVRSEYKNPEGYCIAVRQLRQCWDYRLSGDSRLLRAANDILNTILAPRERDIAQMRDFAISADIGGRGLTVKVRDEIDRLVYTFIRCLRRVALCNNERCRKPFVKPTSKTSYCSKACKKGADKENKRRWYYSPKGQRWFKDRKVR
jgi:hypothetical protein